MWTLDVGNQKINRLCGFIWRTPRADSVATMSASATASTNLEEVIYTDGSCPSQQNKKKRRAGYAVYFGAGDARNISEPIAGERHTNQIGELTAVVVALERSTPGKRVVIYSDSHYVIKGLVGLDGDGPWHKKWLVNGWRNAKGQPVDHRALWERAIAAGARRDFALRYSRAHSGIDGNETADAMARAGARRAAAVQAVNALPPPQKRAKIRALLRAAAFSRSPGEFAEFETALAKK